ncbi:hypothetical protein C7G77_18625, partial [Acinetobacter baumannii]
MRRHIEVIEFRRLFVEGRRGQVGESSRVWRRKGLPDLQVLRGDCANVCGGARSRVHVAVGDSGGREARRAGGASLEGGVILKVAQSVLKIHLARD